MCQLLRALKYMHSGDVIHHNVKVQKGPPHTEISVAKLLRTLIHFNDSAETFTGGIECC
jgi:hypothetical protein